MNIRTSAKLLILATGSFPAWSLDFSHWKILLQECSKKIRPMFQIFWRYLNIYSESKFEKWENKENLNLFMNGPKIVQIGIIIPMLLIKAFFYKLLNRRYIFQLKSMNIRALTKLLTLTTQICLPLVLRNNYSLHAPNFKRL